MDYAHPTIAQTLLISLVGFLTVFVVLVVLMLLITVMGKLIGLLQKSPAAPAPADPAPAPEKDDYKGVTLKNVSEKDAAMIMAIVADDLGIAPDHLRFISIKGEDQ